MCQAAAVTAAASLNEVDVDRQLDARANHTQLRDRRVPGRSREPTSAHSRLSQNVQRTAETALWAVAGQRWACRLFGVLGEATHWRGVPVTTQ